MSVVFDCNNNPLLSGDNDWLAQPADILKLMSHLPNIVENYEVEATLSSLRYLSSL